MEEISVTDQYKLNRIDLQEEYKSFYIVPTHNKEDLIEHVLNGIKNSHSKNSYPPTIVCIIDGCTDRTDQIVKNFKNNFDYPNNIHILHLNDVHEITCLNTALKYIESNCYPNPDDLIFMVQDDVILKEENIDEKFNALFNFRKDLGYVSMRFGTSLHIQNNQIIEGNFIESEFGHWNQLNWTFQKILEHSCFVPVEIAVRSPTCIQWKRFQEVGFFNQDLAPYGFDCHELSIRLNIAGYTNGLFSMRFQSNVEWGSMRKVDSTHYTNRINEIHYRNKNYILNKYINYFNSNKENIKNKINDILKIEFRKE